MVVALWIGGRIWWLLPQEVRNAPLRPASGHAAAPSPVVPDAEWLATASASVAPRPATAPIKADRLAATPVPQSVSVLVLSRPVAAAPFTSRPESPPRLAVEVGPAPLSPAGAVVAASPSRWSGNAYLFVRDGGGNALAAGGQLGGGQAGARIAWRVNRDGPARVALAARAYAPLDDRAAAEAAVGMDFHPLPGRPLRLSIERRLDVGGKGRDAWSAYAVGGFWREIGRGIELDGYAQAGVVGAHAGDLFGDGALRLAARRSFGDRVALRLGGGAWAGAQPGVERLDVGPRITLGLPLGRAGVTVAVEGRFRVAGAAAPGSGVALTLATDF